MWFIDPLPWHISYSLLLEQNTTPKRGLQNIGFVWACGSIMAAKRGSGELEQMLRDPIFNQNMKQSKLEGR